MFDGVITARNVALVLADKKLVPDEAETATEQFPGPFIVTTPEEESTLHILEEVDVEYEIDPSPEYEIEGATVPPKTYGD